MSEQEIKVGQVWASNDGKRVVEVVHYVGRWDDCRVKNTATGRGFAIYGCYLRSRYNLQKGARG